MNKSNDIRKNLNFLFPNQSCIEIRILNVKKEGTVSGYYNDYQKLALDVGRYDGKNNIFFTLNELNESIIGRSYNKLTSFANYTTKDSEIIRRKYILIDIDPKRPSGVSSTDDEHAKALQLSDEIKEHLKSENFNCLISCDSGNGAHLLVPVDMEIDKKSNELIKNFLSILYEKFKNDYAEVDLTTYNPARICKLYGTLAVKGSSMIERPHRGSSILEDIETFEIETVEKEVIEKYVNNYNANSSNNSMVTSLEDNTDIPLQNRADFDVKKWVEEKGFTVTKVKKTDYGIVFEIQPCMFGTGHDLDGGFCIIQNNEGYLTAKCHHNKCDGLKWNDLWKKYEPAKRNPNKKIEKKDKKTQADILLEIIKDRRHMFFKNQYNSIYVSVPELNDVVWELQSSDYVSYLLKIYLDDMKTVIKKEVAKTVIDVIEGNEIFNDDFRPTFTRLGSLNGESYYYYLNDSEKRMVAIRKGKNGKYDYEISTTKDEVMFVPTPGMKSQIPPNKSVKPPMSFQEYMRKYYGVLNENELILHNVLLCYRFLYGLGQPIASYTGAKGSGKTTLCSIDAQIVNPCINSVAAKPENIKDWYVHLNNTDLAVIDNLSTLNKKESDLLCQAISEVSVSSQRQLYSDNRLVIYKLYTSIYLSSIGIVSYQSDLLDRCIFFHTKRFSSSERIEESKFRKKFEEDLPHIMTSIFNILVEALNLMEEAKKDGTFDNDEIYIRITSFQVYGIYLAKAMGYTKEEFINALKMNDMEIKTDLIVESDFATLIKKFMEDEKYIKGTATEVLNCLKSYCYSKDLLIDQFANTPAKFGKALADYEDILKSVDIFVKKRKSNGVRLIEIIYKGQENNFDEVKEQKKENNLNKMNDDLKDTKISSNYALDPVEAFRNEISKHANDEVKF